MNSIDNMNVDSSLVQVSQVSHEFQVSQVSHEFQVSQVSYKSQINRLERVPSLSDLIYNHLQSDVNLLLKKVKLVEKHDIRLEVVYTLYIKLYETIEKTEVSEVLNLYFSLNSYFPRTKRLIFDSLLNLVSKCYKFGKTSSQLDDINYETLSFSVIDNLMRFSEKKFYKILETILNSRDLEFFEKDKKLIWQRYPNCTNFIYTTLMKRILELHTHFTYGIYFKYTSYINIDIVSYFIQDSVTLSSLQRQYSSSNFIIHEYSHYSVNLSDINRKKNVGCCIVE